MEGSAVHDLQARVNQLETHVQSLQLPRSSSSRSSVVIKEEKVEDIVETYAPTRPDTMFMTAGSDPVVDIMDADGAVEMVRQTPRAIVEQSGTYRCTWTLTRNPLVTERDGSYHLHWLRVNAHGGDTSIVADAVASAAQSHPIVVEYNGHLDTGDRLEMHWGENTTASAIWPTRVETKLRYFQ